ncbi:uncharacterized protein LOC112450623 isoform X3 [Kryptolebias marmoratus]|uniref:uncharacterized protein LOC112450623 isoform X3 n=1 Tax=Kryptolebias marmoratus TaxID=37003 RepID=UPI0018AC9620|nr:uncharacterized protein LOC112450623 isoform X3 [Kryptolebias marmoratus]
MESDEQRWRCGIENAISGLERNVHDMTQLIRDMSSVQAAAPTHVSPPVQFPSRTSPIHEPKLPPPENFTGEAKQCRPFLTQCEIHFQLQPSSFPTERAKIAYVISLLSGRAKLWGTAEWQRDSLFCYNYKDFAAELRRVFDPIAPERDAARGLFSLRQGRRSVTDYIIEFHTLAADSHWNDPALTDVFFQGLREEIKDELATRERPVDLRSMEDLATRIDLRLSERRRERQGRILSNSANWQFKSFPPPQGSGSSTTMSSSEEAMQIGRTKLSKEERERRRRGATWLRKHNPHINWVRREITGWAGQCSSTCLQEAVGGQPPSESTTGVFSDISKVPPEYHDLKEVFNKVRATSLPPHRPYDCPIDLLPGSVPPKGRVFSLSRPEQESMNQYIKESLQAGIIRPSVSPAGAGFFFVGKKDGSLRPCIDYRGLNNITIKNKYPLPLMSSAFDIIQESTIFTKLDLRNAYHLIRIREGDEWKTAFNTPTGHYEYLVMPFGLTNAPAVFQSMVNDLLRDMIGQFIFVYLDDILIFSKDLDSHRAHVRQVLLRLLQNNLFVKAEKCDFHQSSTSFLGFNISPGKVSMDQSKVAAVINWPVPLDRRSLQRFLGFANFYRRFIKGFSQVAAPLHSLTSIKERFLWNPEAQAAFGRLKELFVKAPILLSPNPNEQFIVEVDASSTGVGAVLSQRGGDKKVHPCAFFSKRLTPAEQNYDVGERELLAVKLALEEWRHWLEGAKEPFIIWTDHKNLEYLKTAKRLNSRQARWALFFSRFSFTLTYRPGERNAKADALSRMHEGLLEVSKPEVEEFILPQEVRLAITQLERDLRQAHLISPPPTSCPPGRLFVPQELRGQVITFCHCSKLFCHPGISKTLAVLRSQFWWRTMTRDVREFIAACPQCAQAKVPRHRPAGLLRPLPIPSRPWSHVSMDFITGLPPSAGNSVILTIVDRFSKMVHLVPLKKLPSSKEMAGIMAKEVFRLHGIPKDIVSDRGPQFVSRFWREFCKLLGISVSLSSGFHPQTDGQTERANQEVETKLRLLCSVNPAKWTENLPKDRLVFPPPMPLPIDVAESGPGPEKLFSRRQRCTPGWLTEGGLNNLFTRLGRKCGWLPGICL